MSEVKMPARRATAYEADFHAWTQDQAAQLRGARPNSIDWENVADEIESLGRSQRSEIRSRLVITLIQLLKWAYQPEKRNNSWKASILGGRTEIRRELKDSPGLKRYPGEVLHEQYPIARLDAAGDTKLALDVFPESCPFTIEQVLDPDLYPESARG